MSVLTRPARVATKEPKRRLKLEFSGNLIKHLGLLMYSGPVPALAELVANAWDADAKNVELTLPLDTPMSGNETITIKDDGHGMSWEDVASRYLVIGRNRRRDEPLVTKLGRHVMGRKGIGKLAGFGIARVVEIRTVRNKWLTHFAMDFAQMTSDSAAHARYEPKIVADESCAEQNSTTVILRHLSLKRAIPAAGFRDSLARRFAIFDAQFRLKLNGKTITKSEMPTLLRVPPKAGTLNEATIDGLGPIKYWYGFTRYPIEDADARGLSIMVRGRMARPPSMFDISGGVWNQQALEYLTGEVYADGLDDFEDFISTDRQSVNWTEDAPAALRAWGQTLIRHAAREYAEDKAQILRHDSLPLLDQEQLLDIDQRLASLPPTIRATADKLMSAFAKANDEPLSQASLSNIARSVVQLSEDAAGGTSHEGSALIYSLVADRSRIINAALEAKTSTAGYNVLRANPWLFVSPWRIAVEDSSVTTEIARLRKNRPQLSNLKLWGIQHESRRYLVAYGEHSSRARQQLASLARDIGNAIPIKVTQLVFVTPDNTTTRKAGIRVISLRDMFVQAAKSCDVLLDILTSA
jgi:hypothetical protein